MKKVCLIIIVLLNLITSSLAYAEDSYHRVTFDGMLIEDVRICGEYTCIPLRAVCSIANWQTETQTITAQHYSGSVLEVQIGRQTINIWANDRSDTLVMPIPVYIDGGTTYVPLRCLSEALGYTVYWDQATKTTVVYRQDLQKNEVLQSTTDLALARNTVLTLPRMALTDYFTSGREMLSSATYYFPYGESKRFVTETQDLLFYYEVCNGAAWLIWQAKVDSDNVILQEWGTRPVLGDKQSYFFDYFMIDTIYYGIIENGVRTQLGEVKNFTDQGDWQNRTIAYAIVGERKID